MKNGRHVIVRSRDAGVLFGKYVSHTDNGTVNLDDARQMWSWHAAKGGTLLDCAKFGVKSDLCKFSVGSGSMTVFNACGVIECTDEAAKSILDTEGKEWN